MDLLIYLMAKRKKKIFPHKSDLLAYLLSRSTYKYYYQTFTGITLSVDNTLNAPMKIKLSASEMSQSGTPTPESPQDIHTISGDNKLVLSNSDNTISQEAYINLGDIEYCKIGNYEDEFIRINDGTWQLKKSIGKVVFNGSESGGRAPTGTTGDYRFYVDIGSNIYSAAPNVIAPFYCNKFKAISRDNSYNKIEGIAPTDSSFNYKSLIIYSDLTKNMTFTEFQNWLSSNNVTVYYPYATPTYTQITGTLAEQLENIYQKLKSFNGTTNINQVNNDLPFILHCEIAMKNY